MIRDCRKRCYCLIRVIVIQLLIHYLQQVNKETLSQCPTVRCDARVPWKQRVEVFYRRNRTQFLASKAMRQAALEYLNWERKLKWTPDFVLIRSLFFSEFRSIGLNIYQCCKSLSYYSVEWGTENESCLKSWWCQRLGWKDLSGNFS